MRMALALLFGFLPLSLSSVSPLVPPNPSTASAAFDLPKLPASFGLTVVLAWDPSPDPTTRGYNVYWGTASRTYAFKLDVGNDTTGTITNLLYATTYYFAATCYDLAGLESDFSTEISYSKAGPGTNRIYRITPQEATTAAGPWSAVTNWPALTLTNPVGNRFFKFALTNWVQ